MNDIFLKKYQNVLISIFLCFITISAYWPVRNYPFINFDDGGYVTENSHVQKGISLQNILWAFSPSTSTTDEKNDQVDYWHPLTWISHMLDCQMFKLNPHLHHMSNLFFHVLNTILLFLAFVKMTGSPWKSFFVAILFSLHPINVDSTAWIAERKNLLSTSFWMMTILAYIYYAKTPSISRYLLVFISMVLGLLAKPMLVTLPCVLLLLDYWPLNRLPLGWQQAPHNQDQNKGIYPQAVFSNATILKAVLEKIPLLAISIVAIGLSMAMLHGKSQVLNKAIAPVPIRIENALVSYAAYLYKTFWPQKLAVFYPFPEMIPWWKTISALLLLMTITTLVLLQLKNKPYLAVGWFWYLGVLFPVIGLVQGGLWPAMADRWAYVPLIGIFMMIAWGIPDLMFKWHHKTHFLSIVAAGAILLLFFVTRVQLGYWKDTFTLFNHALDITKNNYIAYYEIGMEYSKKSDIENAEKYLLKAIEIKPDRIDAFKQLGKLAAKQKNYEKALNYYNDALMYAFSDADTMRNIADTLRLAGKTDDAIKYYSDALIINPSDPETHNNLGNALFAKGEIDRAEKEFQTALNLNPNYSDACYNLGLAALKKGKINKAIGWYQKALEIDPNYASAHMSLADILFANGDYAQALIHYTTAHRTQPDDEKCNYNIGVILLMQNRPDEAATYFQNALKINPNYEKAKNALILIQNAAQSTNK